MNDQLSNVITNNTYYYDLGCYIWVVTLRRNAFPYNRTCVWIIFKMYVLR